MKVTTNYGLDGKVTINFGTKDLPIDRRASIDRITQDEVRQPNRKEVESWQLK